MQFAQAEIGRLEAERVELLSTREEGASGNGGGGGDVSGASFSLQMIRELVEALGGARAEVGDGIGLAHRSEGECERRGEAAEAAGVRLEKVWEELDAGGVALRVGELARKGLVREVERLSAELRVNSDEAAQLQRQVAGELSPAL